MRDICIGPGELFATEKPSRITAGCNRNVVCILWDCRKKFTVITNYSSPVVHRKSLATASYGNVALKKAIRLMQENGRRGFVEAYIIGGNSYSDNDLVGTENIAIAKEFISNAGFPVVSESIGGKRIREILFDTTKGELAVIKRNSGRGAL